VFFRLKAREFDAFDDPSIQKPDPSIDAKAAFQSVLALLHFN